jgi:hypothetical protein
LAIFEKNKLFVFLPHHLVPLYSFHQPIFGEFALCGCTGAFFLVFVSGADDFVMAGQGVEAVLFLVDVFVT